MLKVTLITPTGAKVETDYANAEHYSIMRQPDGNQTVVLYDAKPEETRASLRAKGFNIVDDPDDDEDDGLTPDLQAKLRAGNIVARFYVPETFAVGFDFVKTLQDDTTFAILSIDRGLWFNRKSSVPNTEFIAERSADCEFTSSQEANDKIVWLHAQEELHSKPERFEIVSSEIDRP